MSLHPWVGGSQAEEAQTLGVILFCVGVGIIFLAGLDYRGWPSRFFSLEKRVSGLRYWILLIPSLPLLFLGMFFVSLMQSNPSTLPLVWICSCVFSMSAPMMLATHRLNDVGRAKTWAFLVLIPIINVLFLLILGAIPSKEELKLE